MKVWSIVASKFYNDNGVRNKVSYDTMTYRISIKLIFREAWHFEASSFASGGADPSTDILIEAAK